jgi:polyisoprenoid-binding protein YceI
MKSNLSPITLMIAVTGLWLIAPESVRADQTYLVDPVHSAVLFSVQHQGAAFVHGRFNAFTADLRIDRDHPEKSSIEFTVKTASVDTGVAKRDQHLKSPDFFNVRQFPVITFKSTKVRPLGADGAEVDGKLTLNGIVRMVTARVRLTGKNDAGLVGFDADLTIHRSDFGMKFMLPMVGDPVIIRVSLEAKPA